MRRMCFHAFSDYRVKILASHFQLIKIGRHGNVTYVMVLDLGSISRGFNSRSSRCQVITIHGLLTVFGQVSHLCM